MSAQSLQNVALCGALAVVGACSPHSDGKASMATGGNAPSAGGSVASGGIPSSGGTVANAGTGAAGLGGAAGNAQQSGGASGASAAAGQAGAGGAAAGAGAMDCGLPPAVDAPIEKLSQTGCMDMSRPGAFSSRVVPYDVNSPLWSDAADKTRGIALPPGAKIHVLDCTKETCGTGPYDDGRWVLPVGTVLVKNFAFDQKLLETRLFVHFPEKWVGYSYQWDEAQTDATIVPDDRVKVMFNTGQRAVEWTYPNRIDCDTCHTVEAGSALGPQTRQMNRVVGGVNQIDHFAELGLFDTPPPKPYLAALASPYDASSGTIEERARSYLHANCSHCHRPDSMFPNEDLRYGVPLKDMGLCNQPPYKENLGVEDGVILAPAEPMRSLMWVRMGIRFAKIGMPQLATAVVDQPAVDLIGEWITSIQTCPQ